MAFPGLKSASTALLTGVLIAFSAPAQQASAQAAAVEPTTAQSEPTTAQRVVDRFHASLINVMKEGSNLGYDGRFQWLSPVIRETFNLPFMAEVTAGIYWAKASEEQRKRFVEAFSNFSTATYAERFDNYGGEVFATQGADEEGRTSVVVRTELTDKDGGHTQLSYLLRDFDGQWKIVDVYLNGSISELAVKKSDYSDILKNGGMDALSKAIEDKIASIAKEESRAAAKTSSRRP